MKKLLLLILPLLAITFNSCSKDDDGGNGEVNKITFNGKSYDITGGRMHYFGQDEKATNIDLVLLAQNGAYLEIEMYVPNGNTKLVAGKYNLNTNSTEFTYSDSYAVDENDNDYEITGGTIEIAVSGDTYTITVNVTLSSGGTAKGTYKGGLAWVDGYGD